MGKTVFPLTAVAVLAGSLLVAAPSGVFAESTTVSQKPAEPVAPAAHGGVGQRNFKVEETFKKWEIRCPVNTNLPPAFANMKANSPAAGFLAMRKACRATTDVYINDDHDQLVRLSLILRPADG